MVDHKEAVVSNLHAETTLKQCGKAFPFSRGKTLYQNSARFLFWTVLGIYLVSFFSPFVVAAMLNIPRVTILGLQSK